MLGLLQGGEAAALIVEPTPIAQAMRQTAVAPAQPCLCERIVNRVTQLRISLSRSLSAALSFLYVNMWLKLYVTKRRKSMRRCAFELLCFSIRASVWEKKGNERVKLQASPL